MAPAGVNRRVHRAVATIAGLVLCFAGAVLAIVPIALVVLFVVFGVVGGSATDTGSEEIIAGIVGAFGSFVAWWSGLRLIRGRPRTILFLRKFGYDDAKEFVTYAASEALGQRWRLVTLDDFNTTAIGSSRWSRRASVGLALVALVIVLLVAWGVGDVLTTDSTAAQEAAEQAAQDADNPLQGAIEAIVVAVVVAMVTAIAVALVAILLTIVAVAVGVFGFASFAASRSLRKAENDRRGRARSRDELVAFLNRIEKAKGSIFAPRISVLRVIDALWREAVTGLADISDAILIDISDPTENLLWEVQALRQRPDVRLVPIGSGRRVDSLVAAGGHDRDGALVLQALAGRSVLVYDDDRKSFARELRRMLDISQQPESSQ